MPRLFSSIRIAPGVRISATPRGLRGHIGPRGMRMHVGGGRTGISTGAGPFTVYQSTGGSTRRRPSSSRSAGAGSAAAARSQQHQAAAQTLAFLSEMHRQDFRPKARQLAPAPELPTFGTLLLTAERQALRGIGPFARSARKAARIRARAQAESWARGLMVKAATEQAARQHRLDDGWRGLMSNDPEVTGVAIRESLASNQAPARLVAVRRDEAWLVVQAPPDAEVPDAKPAVTPAGAPTVRKLNKTERAELIRQMIGSRVLLAAKQTFTAAPGLAGVKVVVTGPPLSGYPVQALVAARIGRSDLFVADERRGAWEILQDLDRGLVVDLRGRTRELQFVTVPSGSDYAQILAEASA